MKNGLEASAVKSAPAGTVLEPVTNCKWAAQASAAPWARSAAADRQETPEPLRLRAAFLRDDLLGIRVPQEWIDYVCRLAETEAWMHYYLWEAFQVLELVGERQLDGFKIVEPGCGAGVIGAMFAMMGADVTLFDNDPQTLARAREHSDALGVTQRIHFVEGDLLRCHLPARSFDLVWNDGTIEHFDDPTSIVQAMACLAKPGGRVLATVPNKWTAHTFMIRPLWRWRKAYTHDRWGREKSFSQAQLRRLLESVGLVEVRTNAHHLRRALFDDRLRVLQILARVCKPLAMELINFLDAMEARVPGASKLGFMVGGIGQVPAMPFRHTLSR